MGQMSVYHSSYLDVKLNHCHMVLFRWFNEKNASFIKRRNQEEDVRLLWCWYDLIRIQHRIDTINMSQSRIYIDCPVSKFKTEKLSKCYQVSLRRRRRYEWSVTDQRWSTHLWSDKKWRRCYYRWYTWATIWDFHQNIEGWIAGNRRPFECKDQKGVRRNYYVSI